MSANTKSAKTRSWLSRTPGRLLILLVVAALVVLVLELTNTTHIFHKSPVVRAPSKPISQLPHQAPANNGVKTPVQNTEVNSGSETDKNGQAVSSVPTDPSQWSTSASGKITLKLPANNGSFKSGSTITGSAAASPVQYRLVDDQAGVISQGSINVVNGNFTATITFTPYAKTGRLDVFNTDSSGRELNEVQVTVNF